MFITQFTLSDTQPEPVPATVVGVVGEVRFGGAGQSARLNLYIPLQQRSQTALTRLARTADGRSLAADVRGIVRSMNVGVLLAAIGIYGVKSTRRR